MRHRMLKDVWPKLYMYAIHFEISLSHISKLRDGRCVVSGQYETMPSVQLGPSSHSLLDVIRDHTHCLTLPPDTRTGVSP